MRTLVSRFTFGWMAALLALLAGCGGGGQGDSEAPPDPPDATAFSLSVQVVDSGGRPLSGVAVSLNGGFDGMSSTTGTNGRATFNFARAPAGEADVATYLPGFHGAWRHFDIASLPTSVLQLSMLREEQASLAVIRSSAQPGSDGSTLVVEVDVRIVDENAHVIETLTAGDFFVGGCDSAWGACILDANGMNTTLSFYAAPDPLGTELIAGTPTALYRVRFVLAAAPMSFTVGRTVNAGLSVRVGEDTTIWLDVPVRF